MVPYWNLVPLAGSIDQAFYGRTRLDRRMGVGFLALDMFMLGGVARSVVFVIRGGTRIAALRAALSGTAHSAAANEAGRILIKSGAEFGAEKLVQQAASRPILLVGSEGWMNHAVSYLFFDGKIYKFHGEPYKLFTKTAAQDLTNQSAARVLSKMNTMKVYHMTPAAANMRLENIMPRMGAPAWRRILQTKGGCENRSCW